MASNALKTAATAATRFTPRATSPSTIGLRASAMNRETTIRVSVVVICPTSCHRPTAMSAPVAPKKPM